MVVTVIQFSRTGVRVCKDVVRDVDAGVVGEIPARVEVVLIWTHRLNGWGSTYQKNGKKEHQTDER